MKQRYRKIDHKSGPGLANNLNFAINNELEPNVKKKIFRNCLSNKLRLGKQTCLTQTYHRLGSGGQPLGQFFLTKYCIFRTFLAPFEITTLLRFKAN